LELGFELLILFLDLGVYLFDVNLVLFEALVFFLEVLLQLGKLAVSKLLLMSELFLVLESQICQALLKLKELRFLYD
jgi:hypothetical protein